LFFVQLLDTSSYHVNYRYFTSSNVSYLSFFGKTWSSGFSARYVCHTLEKKNITYCIGPLSVVGVCETLRRKLCRIIGQLGEPTLYLVHFLFIKENMGEQTLQNCMPCVLFPLSFHSIPLVIVPAEYDLAGRVLC